MKRLLSFFLGMFLCVPTLWAEPVGKEQAIEKARQFYSSRGQISKAVSLRRVPRATNLSMELENDCFYVFTAGADEGFVIISGDDRTPDVLGYADSGSFDTDNMPENMKAWLDEYASQIRYLQQSGNESSSSIDNPPSHPKIAPMIYTKWDQHAPYNNECPIFFKESYGRTLTGCLSTAVAQIMKYHMHPARTTQTIPSYTCKTDHREFLDENNAQYIKVPDIPIMTFDWDNMLNSYDDTESATNKNAVATLMYAVGASMGADYSIKETSIGWPKIKYALVNYFDYDKSMRYVLRTDHTASAWDELIYAELANHRPVCFGGRSTSGGHQFILDGFDGNGYYHVNWGWSGSGNGYYLLGILSPHDESGKSVGSKGYNSKQSALIGIKPNIGGNNPDDEPMTTDTIRITGNTTFTRSSSANNFNNVSVAANFINLNGWNASFDYGYGIYDINDNLKGYISINTNATLQNYRIFYWNKCNKSFNFGANLGNGKYRIVPISRLSGNSQWVPNKGSETYYILATISGNSLKLSYPYEEMVANFSLLNSPEAGGPADLKISLTNNGLDYKGTLIVYAILKGNGSRNHSNTIRNAKSPASGTFDEEASDNIDVPKEGNNLYQYNLDIRGGESQTRTVSVSFAKAGTYDVYLTTDYYKALDHKVIQVTEAKEQNLTCNYNVTNGDYTKYEIFSNRMELDITYMNNGGNNYDNNVYVYLAKKNNNDGLFYMDNYKIDRLTLNAGAQQKHSYVFEDLENGGTYFAYMFYLSKGEAKRAEWDSPGFTVKCSDPEAYAVLNKGTLTFYYDNSRSSQMGKTYSMNIGNDYPGWANDSLKIKQARFDTSFSKYRPVSTAHWFDHHVNLTSIQGMGNLNTSCATTMRSMFYECYALSSVDVSGFDGNNVTDIGWMFYGCKSLKSINFGNFSTPKVTNMKSMFCYCSSLTNLYISKFDTRNVTDMSYLFNGCGSLTSVNLSSFNTSKVTTMQQMFYECSALSNVDVSKFDTQNVSFMGWMFYGCKSLKSINVSNFNTSKVMNMKSMFYQCSLLTSLDVSKFDTQNVTDMSWLFSECTSLKTIYAMNPWNTDMVINSTNMFTNCTSLVGGKGTKYNPDNVDKTYARIDGGTASPGYFTYKEAGKKGDVNGDGSVDVADIASIIDVMAQSGGNVQADVNGDGTVDVADIASVIDIMAANARRESTPLEWDKTSEIP